MIIIDTTTEDPLTLDRNSTLNRENNQTETLNLRHKKPTHTIKQPKDPVNSPNRTTETLTPHTTQTDRENPQEDPTSESSEDPLTEKKYNYQNNNTQHNHKRKRNTQTTTNTPNKKTRGW